MVLMVETRRMAPEPVPDGANLEEGATASDRTKEMGHGEGELSGAITIKDFGERFQRLLRLRVEVFPATDREDA
jgi:hypothetical protein